MHHAIPDHLAVKSLVDGDGLGQGGDAAVLGFDDMLQLVCHSCTGPDEDPSVRVCRMPLGGPFALAPAIYAVT